MEIEVLKKISQMKKRRVPLFRVSIDPDGDYSQIAQIPQVEASVMKELIVAIKEGIRKNKKSIQLFDISYTQYSVELNKDQWVPSLKKALTYYEKQEQYNTCIECRDMIKKLS
jgi:hypothetical protein